MLFCWAWLSSGMLSVGNATLFDACIDSGWDEMMFDGMRRDLLHEIKSKKRIEEKET